MSLHTHSFKESASGNGYIEMEHGVDWTGGSHPFDMRSTRFYQSEVRRLTIDHWTATNTISGQNCTVRMVAYNANGDVLDYNDYEFTMPTAGYRKFAFIKRNSDNTIDIVATNAGKKKTYTMARGDTVGPLPDNDYAHNDGAWWEG